MARLALVACLVLGLAGCSVQDARTPSDRTKNATPTAIDPAEPEVLDGETALYYPDGTLRAHGVLDADGRRQGLWTYYFVSGRIEWQAHFERDVFDTSQAWVEYNADGCVRADSTDGPPIGTPPE